MGYNTEFEGRINTNKPMSNELIIWLDKFSKTRHYSIDTALLKESFLEKTIREMLPPISNYRENMDMGAEGKFLAHGDEYYRPKHCANYNKPADDCPGLWLQWRVTEDGCGIEWDMGEKFYNYTEWLEWLILYIFEPGGYILNGKIRFQGQNYNDQGHIYVENNVVTVKYNDDSNAITKELIESVSGKEISINDEKISKVKAYIQNLFNE